MAVRPQVLEHLGPYLKHPPVAACCELSERIWEKYHEMTGGHEHQGQSLREFFFTRMLYIAEITSTAVRLNASWVLTHAAMSLVRDRYEQAVRSSWLLRGPEEEYHKYGRAYFAKTNKLNRAMEPEERRIFEDMVGRRPEWATETPTKEERAYFEAWNATDLRTMATKRDALPPLTDKSIGKRELAGWYNSIYAHFSSVAHYDHYSIELLGLHKSPDGKVVLAPDPGWPAMLALQNALLDLIQCFEAALICHKKDCANEFESLHGQWNEIAKRIVGR